MVRGGKRKKHQESTYPEARRYARQDSRRRRNRQLGFVVVLPIFLALGAVTFEHGIFFYQQEDQPPQALEEPEQSQLQLQPSPADEPDQSADEAWATAIIQDASSGLAAPDETMEFGHRITLSFDDGPDPATTPAILDVLCGYNLKATFFVIGVVLSSTLNLSSA